MPLTAGAKADPDSGACAHCGQAVAGGVAFCCAGCAAAFAAIQELGLGRFYERRVLDPSARPIRPEPTGDSRAYARFIVSDRAGLLTLNLMVDGLHCGACVWLIESVLARNPALVEGRVNMTSRRLRLRWRGTADDAAGIVGEIERLGYGVVPFDPSCLKAADDRTGKALVRCLAVAGFAAGNVMMLSIAIWSGMGAATRDLLHWISAAVALPAIVYAGRPFFRSAAAALWRGQTNMDVPISVGVILVTGMSLFETIRHGADTYFEASTALLFFLLIGRVLDHQARGRVRATAEQLLVLRATEVTLLDGDGVARRVPQDSVQPGSILLAGMGERIGADGVVISGRSTLDTSLVTGETVPAPVEAGSRVFAGTLNLGAPLTLRAEATGEGTLLAECVRLIAAAEDQRGRFVTLADRIARRYAPVVHTTAGFTFCLWLFWYRVPWPQALLNASAVLIVTCPCALALAVPAVQVLATGRLFRAGILLKSPTALERLATIDTVVFDKTGTLTEPRLSLVPGGEDPAALTQAATLAAASRHPLARALCQAVPTAAAATGVIEHPGEGLSLTAAGGDIRLGSRRFCGIGPAVPVSGPELWFARPGEAPVAFRFAESLRADAAAVAAALRARGIRVAVLSGDRRGAVAAIAEAAGIDDATAETDPVGKVAVLQDMARNGARVLMVGDGLNDGPALAAAAVSMSPSSAADITQNAADLVFQGCKLAPVLLAIDTARRARRLILENLTLSIGYNLLAVPLAICGLVTPWLAALAMSSSSLLVIANSFRLSRAGRQG
jgi:Cu2+-exporting ATPase